MCDCQYTYCRVISSLPAAVAEMVNALAGYRFGDIAEKFDSPPYSGCSPALKMAASIEGGGAPFAIKRTNLIG